MKHRKVFAGLAAALLAGFAARAEIIVTVNHNEGDAATPEFKFKDVPSPSKADAATAAQFTIVNGQADSNGGGLEVLHDGQVPTEADQPSANFFFDQGTEGGRFLVDLGKTIEVKEVNTYSWHTSTRAPQLYKLYASDGSADNFNVRPKRGTDPASCGWKLVASVDTRPKDGNSGGQYGVCISNPDGTIGKYRYLLFDCSRTEDDDDFGNTFYSEIDVIDANAPAVAAAPAAAEAPYKPFVIETTDGKCKITINTEAAPDLRDWADNKLAPVLAKWYPKIVAMLPSDGFTAPTHYSVTIRPERGVAATGGTHVSANSAWLKSEIGREAIGSLVHETVHVVQQYGLARRNNPNTTRSPGWLVEGIADYIRWFKYEPQSHGADILWMRRLRNFTPRYDASYRVTANFLNWVTEKYDPQLVTQLNAAMREGNYRADLWKQFTGKTVEELGDEWKMDVESQLAVKPSTGDTSAPGV